MASTNENVSMNESEDVGVNPSMNLIQYNCQRSSGVMHDLGEWLLRERIQLGLLQEPYIRNERVCGLPAWMRVFKSVSGLACVIVPDSECECMLVEECKFDDAVYVWIKNSVCEIYVVSLYCRPSGNMHECVEYLDRLNICMTGKCVLIGMDANATSGLRQKRSSIGGVGDECDNRCAEYALSGLHI